MEHCNDPAPIQVTEINPALHVKETASSTDLFSERATTKDSPVQPCGTQENKIDGKVR
ncbi:hypothetical protein MWU78_10260 [Arenibacter sp. F26102]|uniref:hypothetical protein n=1 Tax=Arenibacter sp. F26102 TaxID=2926416 RepID=UPI001FF438AD|nr:hypothetical protein [Arenibacter sp. F26102]MCK0146029.1 hypothetical protein [Arenibacter sp. F26102]